MKNLRSDIIKQKIQSIDWKLMIFLLLVLNVKLVIKLIAVLLFIFLDRKSFSIKKFFRQPYLFFYFGMIGIALVNLFIQYSEVTLPYIMAVALGIALWLIPAFAVYHLFGMVVKGNLEKMHRTVTLFFLLHVGVIFISLLLIIFETGTINPYIYKGLNQKYYISTGDYIRGITFDDAVTTAVIAAFGLLYFFYRKQYFFSILCMAGLLIVFSNLTNIFLLFVFVFMFLFRSDRVQKSMIIVYSCMLLIFVSKVSPQNNEYVVSFIYKMIGKPYYLPPVEIITTEQLKQMPDSALSFEQKRKKTGILYIDSMSSVVKGNDMLNPAKINLHTSVKKDTLVAAAEKIFYEYRPAAHIQDKENRFGAFCKTMYAPAQRDSLTLLYDWNKPGKLIAGFELLDFFRSHPGKVWLGAGTGNLSSRLAFKTSALNIAGGYPEKFRYIHPYFLSTHLYVYLFYHSQWQIKHAAANTPDSTYGQLAGEYGIAGLLFFFVLYLGFFVRRIKGLSYGLALLLLLMAVFLIGYWFEQLSIVILFEFLVFLDIRSLRGEEQYT